MLFTTKSPIAEVSAADQEVDLAAIASNPLSINEVGTSLTSQQKFFILDRLAMGGLLSLEDIPPQALFMIEKIEAMTVTEALDILHREVEEFANDPNYPEQDYDLVKRLLAHKPSKFPSSAEKDGKVVAVESDSESAPESPDESLDDQSLGENQYLRITDWELQVKLEASLFEYWSPYPMVRAVSDPYDDPTMSCETLRVYILGIIWTAIGSVINTFFSERQPSINLDSSVVQVFLYPCGVLMSYIMPKWKFKIWRYTIDLNPGPWTTKEQQLATMMYSVVGVPYSANNILIQKLPHFYGSDWVTWGYQILLTLSVQYMGFGFAGIVRRFAVYPVHTVWPYILPGLALNKALTAPEKSQNLHGWTISKYKFFFIVFAATFVWYWIPNYIFSALFYFNWMTWIKPDNFNLATITGSISGLGVNPIPTFDTTTINPVFLAQPFYSTANQYVGSILSMFCIIGIYYSNHLWTAFLPINSNQLFTNTGAPYNVRNVISKSGLFDNEKYQQVGPPFYSAGNIILYGTFFALYPFAFLYEVLTKYKVMWVSMKSLGKSLLHFNRSSYQDFNDPHCRMMSKYPEVQEWVYTIIMVISLVFAIITVKVYPTNTPVWGIFFAIGMNFVFIIPMVSLGSVTGFTYALNVLVELIVGYAIPGNGTAMAIIKAYGTNIDSQAENYITNQKIAHYAKIPTRAMFRVQMLSVLISSFVSLAILNYQIENMENYCMPHQAQKLTCPGATSFFTSSVIWGVIGPKRVFNGLYPILKYCFLIGFLLAPVCAAFKIYGPRKLTRWFYPTVVIGGFLRWAPYNLTYYTGGLYLAYAFMHYIRSRMPAWWEKYNYIVQTGLTAGAAFSAIIVFFAVQYHPKDIDWWGNDVFAQGLDYAGIALMNATLQAPDGYFGPREGHYP